MAQQLNLAPTENEPTVNKSQVYTYKECFDAMRPLVNKYLLPQSMQPKHALYPMAFSTSQQAENTTRESNNNRRKFTHLEDNMMILGLAEHTSKNLELIQQHWLPKKSVKEIRHRYKNLTCQRVNLNPVKNWKLKQSQPLSEREFYLLC